MVSGKCTLRHQWGTTPHLSEQPESRTLTAPVKQRELSFTAGGNAKWCSHFGTRFCGSYKTKDALTIRSSHHVLWSFLREAENTSIQKPSHGCYSRCIQHCQDLEVTTISSVGERINNCGPSRHGILVSTKNKWAVKAWKDMEEPYTCIIKWNNLTWKGFVLYDSNFMTLWKRQNHGDSTQISGCQEMGEGWAGRAQRDF